MSIPRNRKTPRASRFGYQGKNGEAASMNIKTPGWHKPAYGPGFARHLLIIAASKGTLYKPQRIPVVKNNTPNQTR